ncbi:receptor-type tyrosine-protein phosphatase epsilon-like [Patiria miniata]|uniref:protein-tyrosine-phosphatase n=1 Tax=Patiria miniata TaxID=46514 RepID=A0A914AZ38_PATMI|nr:receptor-type tyrosine-protein phosphatase epsilon-like [Patiria miniata]
MDPENNSLKPLTSSTQYQATIPMSGSTTVDIQVFAYRPSSQQLACTIPITLRGLPYLSQPPIVTVTSTSATVSWQAWGSNAMDAGDGPVIEYRVYYSPTSSISWTVAETVSVTNPSQALYSFTVQPLNRNTEYMFSVAAVLQEQGGEGPMSPVTFNVTSAEPEPTTLSPTTTASTTAESGSPVEPSRSTRASSTVAPNPTPASDITVIVVVVAVLAILVIVVLILVALLFRHYRRRRSEEVSVDGLQGKFGSSDHLSSLEAIDNPVSIPLEDVNSNGDVSPEPTATTTTPTIIEKARPKSGTSLISMLDSSSAFAGLPLYPPPERELKKDPIPLKEFVAYVRRAMQGPQLREEWSSFPGIEAICSCDVSQLPDNKPKNRYRNIPAYDHCRVILDHGEDDENLGYINAGYIKGYKNDKAYIATQGPTQATSHDFWKMVWQENVRIIVNGTNLVEDGKNKCHKYWPDVGKSETLGGILISALSEESKGEYTVRSMTIGKVGDKESSPRKIIQFHYTTWPDKDVPKDVTPVLKFVKEFSEATPKDTGPYLIHCSAGVGRTGVIIGIHASLQRARAEKTLDVYNFVADMRDHRVSSVQTPVQYTFIHLALLEALFSDDTTVPAASLGKRVTELKKKKKLAEEFEQLNTITPTPSRERCRNSMANTNQSKNRFPRTLTLEGCRPFLMTPREDGMEYNYINASFVDGFKQRDFAVVTQAPLPNTVLDLWRLVYDYQISSIIMLNAPDPDDTSCPQYWPDKGSEEYGPFTVITTNTADLEGYRIKQMKLEHRRQKRSHSFKHYQVTDWPLGQEVPKSPSALLRLIQTVDKHKPKDKRSASLVHCIDGLNRSGVFCVLKNSLDRLHEEDVVDILQTTKVLRLNRPNLLNSLDMYRFCYEAMLAYVNNPEEFKAEAIPEPVYENTPRDMEKDKPKESIYQNLEPKSSETPET